MPWLKDACSSPCIVAILTVDFKGSAGLGAEFVMAAPSDFGIVPEAICTVGTGTTRLPSPFGGKQLRHQVGPIPSELLPCFLPAFVEHAVERRADNDPAAGAAIVA